MSGARPAPLAERWELVAAFAAICDTPSAGDSASRALGLGSMTREDHTLVFVLNLPPHASIYLGAEGQLGGEAADRVAGFWRAIGVAPDGDADHLASLLALYARLGAASDDARTDRTRTALALRRQALVWEHLWPWVPTYVAAIVSLDLDPFTTWAQLLHRVLAVEIRDTASTVKAQPPLAIRTAPTPLGVSDGLPALLDTLVAPIRSGIVLTRRSLANAAETIGVGYRHGERRFALRAMLEQDPHATIDWLTDEAGHWVNRHNANGTDPTCRWWANQASHLASNLRHLQRVTPDAAHA